MRDIQSLYYTNTAEWASFQATDGVDTYMYTIQMLQETWETLSPTSQTPKFRHAQGISSSSALAASPAITVETLALRGIR